MKKVKLLGISLLAVATVFVACEKNKTEIGETKPEIQSKSLTDVLVNCEKPAGFFELPVEAFVETSSDEASNVVAYCEVEKTIINHPDLGEVEMDLYMEFNAFDELVSISFDGEAIGMDEEAYIASGLCCNVDVPERSNLESCLSRCDKIDHEDGNRKGIRKWRWCKTGCVAIAIGTAIIALL